MKISKRTENGWTEVENKSKIVCDVCGEKLWSAPNGRLYCNNCLIKKKTTMKPETYNGYKIEFLRDKEIVIAYVLPINIYDGKPKFREYGGTKKEAFDNIKKILPKKLFTKGDLDMIAKNTHNNYHFENYLFIAEKINSPLVPDFKQMIEDSYTDDGVSSNKSYSYYEQLMKEVKRKVPAQYDAVYSRL